MPTIQHYAAVVNSWIDRLDFPQQPTGLYEPIKYMLQGGGKRLRPTLLCATADAFNGNFEIAESQALAVEMFHNFTLLHDDVMDNADMRHGKPTVHKQWNVATAILSGDTMLTLANKLAGDCPEYCREKVLTIFNNTAVEIYEGQQYDMNFESRDDVSIEEYMEMIRLKTAVLLGCACQIGAIRGGATPEDTDAISRYGEYLGLAFQLRDDYLDTFGDPATFGKQIGGDILQDKKSYLSVMVSTLSYEKFRTLSDTLSGNEKIKAVTCLYQELGVDRMCLDEIARLTNLAISAIDEINAISPEFKSFFRELAQDALKREH
ncbi:MAG: polyprenyl synthetase family protein [Clostridiales bacterium]|nr:polyprenyl synthetase family protein [Clostridiales bacterium]